jgi:hypothetical protein
VVCSETFTPERCWELEVGLERDMMFVLDPGKIVQVYTAQQ